MTRQPRAVIAEDEQLLAVGLRDALAALWPDLEVAELVDDGIQALRAIEEHQPDILFLDIQMTGLSGIEVAKQVNGRCHVVFVTAFDDYAIQAFEQGAVDYVLKPYAVERLALATQRLRRRIGSAPPPLDALLRELAAIAPERKHLRWINASRGNEVMLITVDEILYFQADTKYTRVVTRDQEALIRRPLKELQDELDPACFWPIHRSTIVNANAIAGVTRDLRGRILVKLKARTEKLAVSEAHEHLFKQM